MTAKEWRKNNPKLAKKGNIRDYTDLLHLVILTLCSKKSLTSKVGDELRLLMLGEY